MAQKIPDVHCAVEDYPVKAVVAWQFPETLSKVQVVVLRDPAGEQEARFDLLHGASLISLRYKGKEILFGETAGASVSMFATRHGTEPELKNMTPYWSAYSPDQGGSSMGISATTEGVACDGQNSMRAIATMIDRGVDNSFQPEPLLGLSEGKISKNFPPGYSTPFVVETNASWRKNPGASPQYYLRLDQNVVRTRPGTSGPLEWYLTAASPWDFGVPASYPDGCIEKTPCSSTTTNAIAAGRYEDAARSSGVAIVAPASGWQTKRAYVRENAEYVVLLYNAVWAFPRHTFAAVLERPLDGVSSFHFAWYVCAGSWQTAVAFAQAQPPPDKTSLPPTAEPPATVAAKEAIRINCQTTEFKPQPNQVDQAVILEDAAGEQKVLFDTTQGRSYRLSAIQGSRTHLGLQRRRPSADGLSQSHDRGAVGWRLQSHTGRRWICHVAGHGHRLRRHESRDHHDRHARFQSQQRLLQKAAHRRLGWTRQRHGSAQLLLALYSRNARRMGAESGRSAAILPAAQRETRPCCR